MIVDWLVLSVGLGLLAIGMIKQRVFPAWVEFAIVPLIVLVVYSAVLWWRLVAQWMR